MTSQRVERTWIRTGGYGRFRGEWVKHEQIALTHITIVNSQKVKIMPTNVANPALRPLIMSMIVESCEFVD